MLSLPAWGHRGAPLHVFRIFAGQVLASWQVNIPAQSSGLSCRAGGPSLNTYPPRQEGRGPVIREELTRLFTWQERHRRLAARLIIAFVLTLVVLAAGSVLI
jgi:hypothetical protein